ncbi:MAG: SLBB domain-containing protein, partial [Synergistales bacterium]|nr:SLBB domain-containing protein [Synergistales bacterium]
QVLGYVYAPGKYVLPSGSKVSDALARAGGVKPEGEESEITLTRSKRVEGEPEKVTIDLRRVLSGEASEDRILVDGDIIFVKEAVRQISVLGEVKNPGVYPLTPGMRLLDAIAQAGGCTDRGDSSSVVVTRKEGSLTVNLDDVSSGRGDLEALLLQKGDIVYVPRAIKVQVFGEVQAPGVYLLRADARLSDAIAQAGGIKPDGDGTKVSVTRTKGSEPQTQVVNFEAVVSGGNREDNLALVDGDIISVPALVRQVSVLGAVRNPGVYQIKKDTKLLDVIAQAGGPTEEGDTTGVTVTRGGVLPAGGAVAGEEGSLPPAIGGKTFVVNLDDIASGKAVNPPVVNGDIVYVPKSLAVQVLGYVYAPG